MKSSIPAFALLLCVTVSAAAFSDAETSAYRQCVQDDLLLSHDLQVLKDARSGLQAQLQTDPAVQEVERFKARLQAGEAFSATETRRMQRRANALDWTPLGQRFNELSAYQRHVDGLSRQFADRCTRFSGTPIEQALYKSLADAVVKNFEGQNPAQARYQAWQSSFEPVKLQAQARYAAGLAQDAAWDADVGTVRQCLDDKTRLVDNAQAAEVAQSRLSSTESALRIQLAGLEVQRTLLGAYQPSQASLNAYQQQAQQYEAAAALLARQVTAFNARLATDRQGEERWSARCARSFSAGVRAEACEGRAPSCAQLFDNNGER
jgi:hypothetical protein